jgi:hypothetical protein
MTSHASQTKWRSTALEAISCGLAICLASPGGAADLSLVKRTGVLPSQWIKGGPDCSKIPNFQVHAYNEDFYILRESGCVHTE